MSGTNVGNQTSSDDDSNDEFPVAAIVCLGVGAYVILIVGIIIIRQQCSARGSCKSQCCEEGGGCCSCNACAAANEACPCCCKCNLDGCLSRICGKPKKINCIDIILCNCGGCTEKCCNWKCCGCCPEHISCCTGGYTSNCCSGVCTDCCVDDSEPGTCGCFCLEVKLRSPSGGGSTRRSTSAPTSLRHFNTHSHSDRISSIQNGRHFDDDQKKSVEDNNDDESIRNKVRLRSSSHSPRHLVGRNRQVSVGDVGSKENSNSKHLRENLAKSSFRDRVTRNADAFEKSNRVNNNRNNDSNEIYLNNSSDNSGFDNRRKISRLRKSVRTGQRSQRFPNHLLVSAETLNASSSSDQFETPQVSVRSLPAPSNAVRRPLPSIQKRANRTR